MTAEQFVYWLQGYMEIANPSSLGVGETRIVKDHLDLVFNKKTPEREEEKELLRLLVVVAIDEVKLRAQVDCGIKTWVSFNSLELTSIPYEIIPAYQKSKSVFTNPKYKRLG